MILVINLSYGQKIMPIVQIIPIGSTARSFAKELADPLKAEYGIEAEIGNPLGSPNYAYNKDRKQYHAVAILKRLGAARDQRFVGSIGVAEVDIFTPDVDFVFGEADRENKVAIISLARLRPEFFGELQNSDLLRRRGRTEMVHEVGHLVGLSHCENLSCVMHASESIEDSDRKGNTLCHECRSELGRISKNRSFGLACMLAT